MAKLALFLMGITLGVVVAGVPFVTKLTSLERKAEIKINNQIIVVDVARDPKARERGLSGRSSLGVNEGMLFIFEEAGRHPFWMRGMRIPVDIVWIRQNRIVGFEENVPPEVGVPDSELTLYYPPLAVEKVLELAAGRAKLLRAAIGDEVKVRPLLPRLTDQDSLLLENLQGALESW